MEIDMMALSRALRPENIKRQFKENNGKATFKLSDFAIKNPDADK